MGNPRETKGEAELQQQLVDVSDYIVFAQFFTLAGLLLGPVGLVGGSWIWYAATALLLGLSLLSAIQWWRLWQRKKELHRRGIKAPDFGKPPELQGIERLLRD